MVNPLTCESEPLTQEKVSIERVSTAYSRIMSSQLEVMKARVTSVGDSIHVTDVLATR